MCDEPATTREHAPPFCFFSEGPKPNLITVPSCWTHNNRQNLDVEYVRNVVVGSADVNGIGLQIFETKATRSLDRSPKLFRQTFRSLRPTVYKGEETGVYKINLPRFKRVMRGIANALFFRDFGHRFPSQHGWWIYGATLRTELDYWGDTRPRQRRHARSCRQTEGH